MATVSSKSKWNSQQIHKQCKNKRHNNYWNKQSQHSVSLTNYCNQYQKNLYSQYNNDDDVIIVNDEYESNLYQTAYWECPHCTFNNIERDLYCTICKLPFKSSTNSKPKYLSDYITFADYLPSEINDIIHYENDIDESIQVAIILSLETHHTLLYSQDIDSSSSSFPSYDQDKLYKARKEESQRAKRANKKLKEQQRLEQLKQRIERRKFRNYLRKCMRPCPSLKSMVNSSIFNGIRDKIIRSYGKFKFNMSYIGTSNIINKFALNGYDSCSKFHENDFRIVYHGTDSKNTQSIIDNGLITGGTRGIPMKHGSAYGRGVYCSPQINTARCYEKGSLFICVVKNKMAKKSGSIWVMPNESDIVPLYLASIDNKHKSTPVSFLPSCDKEYDELMEEQNNDNTNATDYKGQNVVRFIPSFKSLNTRKKFERKIQRKWNAYYKINQYKSK